MRVFALVALAVLSVSSNAFAQGLSDARSGSVLPNPQAAAVDDATSLMVNPAGLGAVRGVELQGGWFGKNDGLNFDHVGDATLAVNTFFGTIAGGLGVVSPFSGATQMRSSLALGLQLDPAILIGAAVHSVGAAGGIGVVSYDIGTQLRFGRAVALGVVGERLGGYGAALRVGLSLRPLNELLTIGIDARLKPAELPDFGQAISAGSIIPGINARLRLGGVVLGVGAEVLNLGGIGNVDVAATGLVQFDFGHFGIAGQGGVFGLGQDVLTSGGGVRARASTVPWASMFSPSGRWLSLHLTSDGGLVDSDESIWDTLFGEAPSATWVLAALDNAVTDPSVEGVVLRFEGLALGFGRAAELRGAITRLRAAGKKVGVYMVSGDDVDAWVASAADEVWLAPSGSLAIDGVRARMIYLADVLARIGISAEAVSAGRYKSAPRTFTHSEPSPEEIEVENALLDGVYSALVDGLATGRDLTPDEVKAIIDLGGLSAQEALDKKLVDSLAYADEVPFLVGALAGRPGERVQGEEDFINAQIKTDRWDVPQRIAIVPITGSIQMGRASRSLLGGEGGAGADDIVDAITAAADDPGVVAIVLRIDSPGGDALASDLMWRAAMLAREKKPVIASMGDVAASGGYYVAAAANEIFAEPNTVTGSIGVFGLMFNGESLANDLGVRSYEIKRGARPGPDLLRGATDEELERLQVSVDHTYERFLDAVVAGRGENRMNKDKLRGIAEGHVWTGAQALEHKLIDREGSIVDALRLARERAGFAADAEIGLAVFTGKNELPGLADLGGMVSVATGLPKAEALAFAAKLLFVDPELAAFAAQSEGKPLVLAPTIEVR